MSPEPPEDERPDPEREEGDEREEESLPPPATWAGRQAHSGEDEADEGEEEPAEEPERELGAGITDEFALDDEVPEEEHEPPPPVEEPPDPEEPPPVEEPPAPGAPPSGDTVEDDAVEADAVEAEDAEAVEGEPEEAAEPGEEVEDEEGEAEEDEAGEPTEAAEEPEEEEAPEPTGESEPVTVVAQPRPLDLAAAAPAEDAPDEDGKPPRAGLWPRFIAAAFVIIISMASATSASLLLYLEDIAEAIGQGSLKLDALETVEGGEPQSVLILGSDIRPEIEDKGRSDTTMLLRLDADKNVLSLLSLPRDLQVNIPGYGIGKLNEAYTIGGPKLTLEVVKDLTNLEINHVVNIDFAGFAKAVDAIECVFVDVDRDYFHSNEGIFNDEDKFAEIDIDAGYQQLCGLKALQYVRYRHDDNDLVRAARQQSFLREARQKVPPDRLFTKRKEFIKIFTRYTTSDIDDPIAMLDVLKLFVELRDAPVRRIEFQGDIGGPNDAYVTASNEQIKGAIAQFLGDKPAPADQPADNGGADGGGGDGDDGGGREKDRDGGGDGGGDPGPQLIDASDAASRYALQFDGKLRFPVIAPVELKPGSTYSDDSRAYTIDTYDGEHHPSYKMVFELGGPFGVPEYYGAMGTKWSNPPILENPSETRMIGDRNYLLFYEGDRLQVVGFKTPDGAYWISNTLLGTLSEEEMLAVAESMKPFSPER